MQALTKHEVVSEWEDDGQPPEEAMQTDGVEDDTQLETMLDAGDGGSDKAASSSGTTVRSQVDIERLIEASQQRIGAHLLDQSAKRMDIRTQQLLDRYDKKVVARLASAQKDILRVVDRKIDDRMTTAEQHMSSLLSRPRPLRKRQNERRSRRGR